MGLASPCTGAQHWLSLLRDPSQLNRLSNKLSQRSLTQRQGVLKGSQQCSAKEREKTLGNFMYPWCERRVCWLTNHQLPGWFEYTLADTWVPGWVASKAAGSSLSSFTPRRHNLPWDCLQSSMRANPSVQAFYELSKSSPNI